MAKVIISCAVTGAIHTPSMSDYLPITPEEIARSSIEAAEAGAAIIHLHARNPVDGSPTPDPAVFMKFLPVIKQSTDAVINITTGGGLTMTLEERLAAIEKRLAVKPDEFGKGAIEGVAGPEAATSLSTSSSALRRLTKVVLPRRRGCGR